jgi:hypothetical protein
MIHQPHSTDEKKQLFLILYRATPFVGTPLETSNLELSRGRAQERDQLGVRLSFVAEADVSEFDKMLPKTLRIVPGTMQIHQITTTAFGVIMRRQKGTSLGGNASFEPSTMEIGSPV